MRKPPAGFAGGLLAGTGGLCPDPFGIPPGCISDEENTEAWGRLCRLDLVGQFRDDLEEIADQTVIRDLEDRGFFVFVDRDDDLRVLHPG